MSTIPPTTEDDVTPESNSAAPSDRLQKIEKALESAVQDLPEPDREKVIHRFTSEFLAIIQGGVVRY